jgi:PAS domain S-box-containing protein
MRQLTLSEKRYSDLFHFSPQPMWVYDAESLGFLDVNQAAILQYGYTREEFLRMTLEKLQQGNAKPRLSPLKPEQFHDNYTGIFTHRKKDGTTIQVEIRSNTIDFKGRKAGLILASDITQNLAYIETIEQQNARLQEIAWTQSHVVRAPLARMMGIIDLLQTTSCQDENVKAYLELLMESSREFDQIIREIVRKSEQLGKKPE